MCVFDYGMNVKDVLGLCSERREPVPYINNLLQTVTGELPVYLASTESAGHPLSALIPHLLGERYTTWIPFTVEFQVNSHTVFCHQHSW